MLSYGIDVSRHNGKIDWKNLAKKNKEISYAILRAGYGKVSTQKDDQFENNYKGCKDAGLYVGCYWYSYATTPEEAEAEARCCLNAIKGKEFDYPVYFDVEEARALNKGKNTVSAMIRAFCTIIEQAGYWAGIYMSASAATDLLTNDVKRRYAMWVADWREGRTKPAYTSQYGMWQYTSKGKLVGSTATFDLDVCSVSYPSLIRKKAVETGVKENERGDKTVTVTVKKGDCLWNYAVKYYGKGSRWKEIQSYNNLKSDVIKVGQVLRIKLDK